MMLPGQSEVAFLRSPVAHGRIVRIDKPQGCAHSIFIRDDLDSVADMVAENTVPGYKLSRCPPLAHDKVRFVGEAVAMCVASTRAQAEDLCEQIELDINELPVIADAAAATDASVRIHEEWEDNNFLTLNYE